MANLIPGEQLNIIIDPKGSPSYDEKDVVDKYIRGEVRIVTEQARYPLDSIKTMIKGQEPGAQINYDLNPDYQRRRRWSDDKKSKLIESIIINIPIPPVFLYEYDYGKYEVMDGKQRLSAISDFYSDSFSLTGLDEWAELNGKTYSSLPEKIRKAIDRRYISSIILLKETTNSKVMEDKLKSLVFERLNSGGVDISPQEMRNALYKGNLNKLCIKLSRNEKLCLMWNIPVSDEEALDSEMFKRMEDVELVLRFFTFRQEILRKSNFPTFKRIFDEYLRLANNTFTQEVLEMLETKFNDCIDFCFEMFGEKAFALIKRKKNTGELVAYQPGRLVYDPLMLALDEVIDHKDKLIQHRSAVINDFANLYANERILFDGRNTGLNYIYKRKDQYLNIFSNYI